MPAKHNISPERLLTLIGQQVVYNQHKCQIIELLDGSSVVLQVLESETNIQASQYGEGHRNVPVTYIVPIFDGEGQLHHDLVVGGLNIDNFIY